jgi:hypothetical protein
MMLILMNGSERVTVHVNQLGEVIPSVTIAPADDVVLRRSARSHRTVAVMSAIGTLAVAALGVIALDHRHAALPPSSAPAAWRAARAYPQPLPMEAPARLPPQVQQALQSLPTVSPAPGSGAATPPAQAGGGSLDAFGLNR